MTKIPRALQSYKNKAEENEETIFLVVCFLEGFLKTNLQTCSIIIIRAFSFT